ncbi:hypothetical protein [Cellulomonas telluris]|uniref:hypothetical protein n=1 Tax=Cellulomonas telluris TaxID=2306636 RepID=UPI0010A7F724|nr:hypothetical protein [Cellulomonas telluris]
MPAPAPLPPTLLRLARTQEWLLSAGQCDAAGVGAGRRAALRRAGALAVSVRGVDQVLRLADGAPVPVAGGDETAARRRRTAWSALLAAGVERAVATGCCALALHGVDGLPVDVVREVATLPGASHRLRGGTRVRTLAASERARVGTVGAARVVDPVTALAQAVPELTREHAVAVLDSALQRGLVREDELADVRAVVRGRRGAARSASWWDLVDGRAQSPLETWARLQCRDAGVPPHDLQVAVRDATGRTIARGDLGWSLPDGRLLVLEVDGAGPHSAPRALFRDRERQNAVVATGALVLRVAAREVHAGAVPSLVVPHLGAAPAMRDGAGTRRRSVRPAARHPHRTGGS